MDESPNAICDMSGFKLKQSDMVKQWDGAMVGRKYVDRRNPQDFVRGVPDRQSLAWARPEAPDRFIARTLLDEQGRPIAAEDGAPLLEEQGLQPVKPSDL